MDSHFSILRMVFLKVDVHLCIIFNIFADIFCIEMLKELYALAENSNNNGAA